MIRLHVIITLSVGVVEYYIHVHVHTWKSESKLQLLFKNCKKTDDISGFQPDNNDKYNSC